MPRPTATSTRDRILDATAELMRSAGLSALTTREIARAAGLTEAALYRHFKSKEDLLTSALAERLPIFIELLKDLPQCVGQHTVRDNLRQVAQAAVPFYRQVMPLLAAIFSDPNLLAKQRLWAEHSGRGPQRANAALAAYLRGEAELGRIPHGMEPEAAASLLLGACMQRAFLDEFRGIDIEPEALTAFAEGLVHTLLRSD